MTNWDAIYSLVSPWYQTGLLAEADKPTLQAAYTELTGDTGERCRRCESYWSDVQHTLRYHLLKKLGYPKMGNTNKYIISEEAGYLQVRGLPYVYVNKGKVAENESAKHLTDAIAEQLLKENPDRSAVIIKNPDYEAEAAKPAGTAKAKSTAPAKPKTTAKPAGTAKTDQSSPTTEGQTPDLNTPDQTGQQDSDTNS